jgi:alpha-L-glutamate ligase-like protein
MMLVTWRSLKRAGVLGMNQRQAEAALYNPRRLYPLVDDKLLTKARALRAGISVPPLYEFLETHWQTRRLHELLEPYTDFVIKPNRGSGGQGVVVVSGRVRDGYRLITGETISRAGLTLHVSNILAGMYSLSGEPDQALIEYRVRFDPLFDAISYAGVPDLRIIVFLGVPIMSMARLPTRRSNGKANLHKGAIGVGIDLATGITRTAVWGNRVITHHPDTGAAVQGVLIPGWGELLRLAARSYELSGLGLQGVDIVLDRNLGPMILELNARPGLAIQIANRSGLRERIEVVKQYRPVGDVEQRVRFAREQFGADDALVPSAHAHWTRRIARRVLAPR